MVELTPKDRELLRATLQDAAVKCSERCLYQSAKWAAELLNSLEPTSSSTDSDTDEDSLMANSPSYSSRNPKQSAVVITTNVDPNEARLEAQETHKYLLAKSLFDCREYDRCAAVFLPDNYVSGLTPTPTSPQKQASPSPKKSKGKSRAPAEASAKWSAYPPISQRSLFLALYAKFMGGEKRKDEDSEMILGPLDGGVTANKELVPITRGLANWFEERSGAADGSQGWLEYLYGIVLSKSKNVEEAKNWLIRSVNKCPYNWGAWQELSSLLETVEELNQIMVKLPLNLMTLMFHLFTSQELYQFSDAIHTEAADLRAVFPSSDFLQTQRALLYYHSKDFDEAELIFSELIRTDPHRIDALDHYSNILYVMSLRPKLAFLAQLATATDKFRPETCCIVGNYYSLTSNHEKAVMYFRRALTLDRSFLSAWTLMGHEYVEMKNTHAAIESYRRAVDINRKDYRAWYGLGQAYEVLEMYSYSLWYYQKAAGLKPFDAKMWMAVGTAFNKMDRPQEAIKSFKRALIASTYYESGSSFGAQGDQSALASGIMDPETLYLIALMYEKLGNLQEAASYMELTLAQESEGGDEDGAAAGQPMGITPTTSRARMWLAKWEVSRGELARAMELAKELRDDGVEVEEAKALIRELRSKLGDR
ncbi:MAG: Anaphase-promoting complex subunit 23 [Trizodia sp. TS-e1964]|nr:MAG: Anaphase-promoting complex subunit 23 [Trizodia sp. TS-e1964]